jgi:hypothetical protein
VTRHARHLLRMRHRTRRDSPGVRQLRALIAQLNALPDHPPGPMTLVWRAADRCWHRMEGL